MGFGESVRTVYKQKYFTFSGRASRSEYWWAFLAMMIVGAVLMGIAVGLGVASESGGSGFGTGVMIILAILGLAYLAIFIPTIAVAVRRLHDRNMSGWWYLGFTVFGFIPYIGWVGSIVFLVILALKGTDGDNKYGSDPLKGAANPEVFA